VLRNHYNLHNVLLCSFYLGQNVYGLITKNTPISQSSCLKRQQRSENLTFEIKSQHVETGLSILRLIIPVTVDVDIAQYRT
jgi:hypothetical protein